MSGRMNNGLSSGLGNRLSLVLSTDGNRGDWHVRDGLHSVRIWIYWCIDNRNNRSSNHRSMEITIVSTSSGV